MREFCILQFYFYIFNWILIRFFFFLNYITWISISFKNFEMISLFYKTTKGSLWVPRITLGNGTNLAQSWGRELVTHLCKLVANDTKLIGVIKNSLDIVVLQQDIDKLVNWLKRCKMEFNEGKCKVMNIGGLKATAHTLSIENSLGKRFNMQETRSEKGLGFDVNSKLKWVWVGQDDRRVIETIVALWVLKNPRWQMMMIIFKSNWFYYKIL